MLGGACQLVEETSLEDERYGVALPRQRLALAPPNWRWLRLMSLASTSPPALSCSRDVANGGETEEERWRVARRRRERQARTEEGLRWT